jgi:arylformamidase
MSLSSGRVHEVSRPLQDSGVIYPGDPDIVFRAHSSIERGDPANVTALALGSHSGTHVDAPSHFLPGRDTVDRLPLERLIGPAVVLDLPTELESVGADDLARQNLHGQRRVLLRTRNSAVSAPTHFTPGYCALTPGGAEYLLERGVELVGIDALSIEPFGSADFAVHHLLLARGVVIVEGLDLSSISAGVYQFVCLPLRLEGLDGAPARAVLIE